MTRRYGPIGTSVWDSEKFLSLKSDAARLGYLYLIACPHGNSVGVFRLPVSYFAADRRMDLTTASAVMDDMEDVGLIERGRDDQIRIVKWFWNETGANSPSTGTFFCKALADARLVKPGTLRTRAIVEMVFSTLTRAEAWNPDSPQISKMLKDIQAFLTAEARRDPAGLRAAIAETEMPEKNTMLHTVLDMVSYTLGGDGVSTLYHIQHKTLTLKQRQETDTDTETDTETGDKEELRARESELSAAPPSSPAKSGRSGRKIPPDLQAKIDSLGKAK